MASSMTAPMVATIIDDTIPLAMWNAQAGHQPAADQGADNPDGYVADQAKSAAVNNFPGQPAGDKTDQQNDKKTFARYVHCPTLLAAS